MSKSIKTLLSMMIALALIFSMTVTSFAKGSFDEETEPVVVETESMDLNDAKITGITDQAYTGKSITLDITVKSKVTVTTDGEVTDTHYNSKALKNGTDYTVAYSNNKNIGTATVTIKGKGSYKGTVKKTFKIAVRNGTLKKVGSDYYVYKDDKPLKSGWVRHGNVYCYAKKDGKLKKSTFFTVNGKRYYAGAKGGIKKGVFTVGKKKYYGKYKVFTCCTAWCLRKDQA